jgi:hypothetical protein
VRIQLTTLTLAGMIVLAVACENRRPSPTPVIPDQKTMANEDNLTLKVGEVRRVTLQSRGAVGLQLIARIGDDSIVRVERQEYIPADSSKTMPTNIGGPVPAIFAITALRAGETEVTFAETRSWDKNFKETIQKHFKIVVKAQ